MREYTIIKPVTGYDYVAFGFLCGAGWYPLIFEMLDEIQAVIDKEGISDFEVLEIKEKYGGLRVYVTHFIDEVADIIDAYEKKSLHVCELCGMKGRARWIKGWLTTVCDACYTESKK